MWVEKDYFFLPSYIEHGRSFDSNTTTKNILADQLASFKVC